jgi:ribosome-binding protein aMBF1 (putative translation factor)
MEQDWTPVVISKKKDTKPKQHIIQPASSVKTTITKEGDEITKLKVVSQEMGKFISKARLEKKWNQEELAKNTNLDKNTINKIEQGGCVYNANNINRIAKALGVNIPRK